MPIARLTNVASLDAVLGEIYTFLNATGDWTISLPPTLATKGALAGGRDLIMSNGDVLVGLRSTTGSAGLNRLYLFDGSGTYVSGPPDSLPGNSGWNLSGANYENASTPQARVFDEQFAGPFPTVTLFTDDPSTYCHVAIEVSAGRFRHLWFGNMLKYGTWTGGAYYATTYWDDAAASIDNPAATQHTTPMDGSVGDLNLRQWTARYSFGGSNWIAPTEATVNSVQRRQGRGSVRGGLGHAFRSVTETPFSGLVALQPITVWAWRLSDTPDSLRMIGRIPDVFEVNMQTLAPGESYFIGPDEYVVFPLATKRDPAERLDNENSGNYGYAYKVNP